MACGHWNCFNCCSPSGQTQNDPDQWQWSACYDGFKTICHYSRVVFSALPLAGYIVVYFLFVVPADDLPEGNHDGDGNHDNLFSLTGLGVCLLLDLIFALVQWKMYKDDLEMSGSKAEANMDRRKTWFRILVGVNAVLPFVALVIGFFHSQSRVPVVWIVLVVWLILTESHLVILILSYPSPVAAAVDQQNPLMNFGQRGDVDVQMQTMQTMKK